MPKWRDVKDVTSESVGGKGIEHITLLSGGFPCQPFSNAGKRRGKEDDRHLWPEMFRVVSELRPAWVLGENVAGFINMELPNCIADLESIHYSVRAFVIPACGVEAWHRRDRVFIVAADPSGIQFCRESQTGIDEIGLQGTRIVSDTEVEGLERANPTGNSRTDGWTPEYGRWRRESDWWTVEPAVGRVATGISFELDCIGGILNAESHDKKTESETSKIIWNVL